ncbi:hypothetical protein BDP27DRAFT_1431732 [Rhodocollybia butyracea]|uniref:Uncharacterized protein n=1 Tax=Rhodocollybia butyracea TaxID=206335 RepID=A0A9P5TYG2_9AGAR|nr:hypothetical protein BDP27DRAFT_1431732 [Rhodocollybia butyracea]
MAYAYRPTSASLSSGSSYALCFLYDVIWSALNMWRRPLSFVLFLWLTSLLNAPLHRVTTAILKPLCAIPGIGLSRFCQVDLSDTVAARKNSKTLWADFPHLMEAQTFTFDALLDNSVGGSGLSLEIKKAEMAIADLSTLVEFSQLKNPKSLTRFAEHARNTGRGLRLLSSWITGAVDLIIAVNGCAMRTLSSIPSSCLSRAIAPFTSQPSTSDVVLRAFVDSLNTLTSLVEDLILLAEVEILDIERLEEQLLLVHTLVVREGSAISSAKAELLGDIWTMLGGNRCTLQGYDKNLDLL